MKSNWYFARLFRHSKFLFALVAILFVLHINANFFFGGQQSPFFHWNLYAEPVAYQDSFSFWEIRYNGDRVLKIPHTWEQPGAMLITLPLMNYMYMVQHGRGALDDYILHWNAAHPSLGNLLPGLKFFPDSVEMNAFPGWFILKLEQYLHEPVNEITVYETFVKYNVDGSVELLSTEPICTLEK